MTPPAGRPTGVFFERQELEDLAAAMDRLEAAADAFEPAALVRRAARFSDQVFLARICKYLAEVVNV